MGRAPHEDYEYRRQSEAEFEIRRVALEAKYGVPYEQLPEILHYRAPEHPQHANARRFDYLTRTGFRWNYQSRSTRRFPLAASDQLGWRTRRRGYLQDVEAIRQAEITVRKMRAKRTGRGKLPDRKAHVHARERIEAREWREEL